MYKVNDYEKEDFKRITNKDGLNTYFIKVNRIYVEVDKEIYLTCLRSYMKIKYNKERVYMTGGESHSVRYMRATTKPLVRATSSDKRASPYRLAS